MTASTIESARLRLVALDPAFLRASLDGRRGEAERRLGARLPEPWPQLPDVLRMRLAQIERDPELAPWLTRLIVETGGASRLVGVAGFHGPPGGEWLREFAPQGVELGYTVFEPWRRRGIAREACAALIAWATARGVRELVLSIGPENEASAALARQLGFAQAGTWHHEVRGLEHVYRLRVEQT